MLIRWKLKPGDIYNSAFVSDFEFKSILNQPWAKHSSTSSDTINTCEQVDDLKKTVSLILTMRAPKKRETISPDKQHSCGGGLMFFSFVGERFETAPPSQ